MFRLMDNTINVDFTGGQQEPKEPQDSTQKTVHAVPAGKGKKIAINLILTAIIGAILYYFMIPAFNFKAFEMYQFIGLIALVYVGLTVLSVKLPANPQYTTYVKRQSSVSIGIVAVLLAVGVVGYLVGAPIFRAKSYAKLMNVEDGDFTQDVAEIDFSSVPVLDEASAMQLATRTLGDLPDYVSQFVVSPSSTQINYKGAPVRVTPLAYGDIFKWLKNTKSGIPAYILVDMNSKKSDIVRLPDGGMRYTPAEHFNRYLMRHLRFQFPTYMFRGVSFEIDEAGAPYWIVSIVDKKIGLFGGTDVIGAAVVNAVSGKTDIIATSEEGAKKLHTTELCTDEEWQWIDRIYDATILNDQFNYYGKLSGGFINSIIGQEGVKVTSPRYNYLAINDDVYMYTGVTSITSDQSIIGFVLSNQRTKETKYYPISGALETTAQTSAQGAVQQYGYKATFPLLLNISGEPTYFMALKDTSELVKMYAMVNVKQSTVVGVGYNLAECTENYAAELKRNGINLDINIDNMGTEGADEEAPATKEVSGVVSEIRSATTGGETYFYIKLQEGDTFYKFSLAAAEQVVLLNVGDTITCTVATDAEGKIQEATFKK